MKLSGYLYIVDETGEEVPGSRRSAEGCRDIAELADLRRRLEAMMGDGCMVLDSEVDRRG